MADTPNDNGTLAETPNESFVRDRDAHFGSSSDTDVEVENVDEERGKDHIQKRLTLTFQDVTVRVTAPDEALGETLWSRVDPRQLAGLFKRNNRPMRVGSFGVMADCASLLTWHADHLERGFWPSQPRGNGTHSVSSANDTSDM